MEQSPVKITATGMYLGEKKTIIFENGRFNDEDLWLELLLEKPEAIGGTYHPEKYEPLNVYYTLKDRYFDELIDIQVEGKLGRIPYKKGVIY